MVTRTHVSLMKMSRGCRNTKHNLSSYWESVCDGARQWRC